MNGVKINIACFEPNLATGSWPLIAKLANDQSRHFKCSDCCSWQTQFEYVQDTIGHCHPSCYQCSLLCKLIIRVKNNVYQFLGQVHDGE